MTPPTPIHLMLGTLVTCMVVSGAQSVQDGAAGGTQGKSLDELLGIPAEGSARAASEGEQARRESLHRILTRQEAQDTFEVAVQSMRRSAALLESQETGVEVQRIQEDVLARLDMLIDSAQQQQQQQQSSSNSQSTSGKSKDGSKGSKGSEGKGAKDGEEKGRREAAEQRAKGGSGAEEARSGDGKSTSAANSDENGNPLDPESAVEGGALEETDEEWGNLPPRTREIIRQGIRERMSTIYRRWTEAYYRRIAEEAKP